LVSVALSIAGSDSSGGAGIQADLKTFFALGVYGCTAITAITAQNTQKVFSIFELSAETVKKQIESVMNDIPPSAIKLGMLYGNQIIKTVRKLLDDSDSPIIVDPIYAAGTGARLLSDNAIKVFISDIIPISTLITPNRKEVEVLTNIKVDCESKAVEAARALIKLGVQSVIIKDAHFNTKHVTDFFLDSKGRMAKISNPRIHLKMTHGSGCNFSAAITAFIARGFGLDDSFRLANQYVHDALKNASKFGTGACIANPISAFYQNAMRYNILHELQAVVEKIQSLNGFGDLIPETQSNIVYALPDAATTLDVAAVKGRIIRIGNIATPASGIEFGASKHMASAVLSYMTFDRLTRSAMNIKYDQTVLLRCKYLFNVSAYDRKKESKNIKNKEGSTIPWGIKNAMLKKTYPDVIYHKGDIGKEPMILIFGRNPLSVYEKIKLILQGLSYV
jgi:hydroxymethylpyrimidine kinase / phosphomethylpyrimidine kinase / thiamine-phosphate diphosphorylase